MLQLNDPKYQNFFIEQLGERFDSLDTRQLLQFGQNMAIAGLNQEDIFDAITQKLISEPKHDTKALVRLADTMIELNLHNSKSYETLKEKMLEHPVNTDRFFDVSEQQFFIRNVLARNKQNDPEIKPLVSALPTHLFVV